MRNIASSIYQIGKYKDIKDLNPTYHSNVQAWKNLNPDWEYNYTNDIDAGQELKEFDADLYELYRLLDLGNKKHGFSGAFKTDVWRYVKIYKEGGIYADLDSAPLIPLEMMHMIKYKSEENLIIPPRSYGTFKSSFSPIECFPCDEFLKIKNNKFNTNDYCLNNSMFAGVKNSEVLNNLIKEILSLFDIFKKLHKNINDMESHQPISSISDPSTFTNIVNKNIKGVSQTFIYGEHQGSTISPMTGKIIKNFKEDFVDYEIFYGKRIKYSEFNNQSL